MYGKGIIDSLRENAYPGKTYPINPKRDEILGLKCFKNLAAIGEPVDLAVLIIGRNHVLNSLEECVAQKAKGAHLALEADEEENGWKMIKSSRWKSFQSGDCCAMANSGYVMAML
jgi:acyl-CoA synthetase (NDP forming)